MLRVRWIYITKTTRSRGSGLDLLALDALPLDADGAKDCQHGGGDGDVECPREGLVVHDQHLCYIVCGDDCADQRGAGVENLVGVEVGHGLQEALEQLVGLDVLGDGDHDGAAEGLAEDDDGGAGGHVGLLQDCLHGDQGQLHAAADADAIDDLVADPGGVVGADLEGRHETGANAHHDAGEDQPGHVVAEHLGGGT